MNMNELLETVYAEAASEVSLEKTAAQHFQAALGDTENPFEHMELDELLKLAQDLEADEAGLGEDDVLDTSAQDEAAEMNKTAAAMFGGQLMAHAVVHELGLIKEAVANGICRVCKENHLDVEGSSVCSACMGA